MPRRSPPRRGRPPALLALIAPAVGGLVFGLRAQRRGRRAGLTPVIVASLAIVGSIALKVLAFVITR
ncbi:hypothetical protein QRX60_44495 [Amycolatopsis mongoliensis]|uniref:Uncharacterized protein n=1 Tax=Amycolatopsis mongoliensis TaxID=715475 RepID=A0A9Y2JN11_9PSEU|nr:hypothetical protein [Amycolatopsis sp. 4-36]WIY01028.1 hypothetical protein QRX60_44495 [Amycolatopsis sp. 4-36]